MVLQAWIFLVILMVILAEESGNVDYPPPIENFSSDWIKRISSAPGNWSESDIIAPILYRQSSSSGLAYACGFLCIVRSCESFFFGIAILQKDDVSEPPQIIWLANRNNPVNLNSTLFTSNTSSLVLADANGDVVWTANSTDGLEGMNLTDGGNLILFDVNKSVVWQSFDHPTDTLAPGQVLEEGKSLNASVSKNNVSDGGQYSCYVKDNTTYFAIGSNPPIVYLSFTKEQFQINGVSSFSLFSSTIGSNASNSVIGDYYTKLENDGHLRQYQLGYDWGNATDALVTKAVPCKYPLYCGEYGICHEGQCSCPQARNASIPYFNEIDSRQPNHGCSLVVPLDCNSSALQRLVKIEQVTYFTFRVDIGHTDANHCVEACLAKCNCKAAIFRFDSDPSDGDCYLPTEIYSLLDSEDYTSIYHVSVFLKVQSVTVSTSIAPSRKTTSVAVIFGCTIGALLFLVIASVLIIVTIRKRIHATGIVDHSFENHHHVSGMPTRFSLNELKIATEDFNVKLGEGGFGSVFQGLLLDGTKIAVKRLDGVGQVKKSFLAEVGTIGNIHHVNLVRLIGYCAEKSRRLLVYEYMENGSLDKWIDHGRKGKFPLSWECRKQIVLDIAKGLAYLHEDCRQKIIHLDVKPENILLNENFEAKLSDFGLSKLLSRDQSNIQTTMRGTPGYLAPEWISSIVTERADVYSFGVVIMEILSGRKIIDESLPEDEVHLLTLFARTAEEGKLMDMVDKSCEEMVSSSNSTQVVKMMQIALWCLQNDYLLRPGMSLVVKVLEGNVDIDLSHLDYRFISPLTFGSGNSPQGTILFPSVLSGPR